MLKIFLQPPPSVSWNSFCKEGLILWQHKFSGRDLNEKQLHIIKINSIYCIPFIHRRGHLISKVCQALFALGKFMLAAPIRNYLRVMTQKRHTESYRFGLWFSLKSMGCHFTAFFSVAIS